MALPVLPSGWENYNPLQKIDWFNANQVDEGTLRNYASQADIDWMKSQGYQGSYAPIETKTVTGVKPGGLASVAPQPVYTPEPVVALTATPASEALASALTVEPKTDVGATYTEDRYNPNDPASKYYIADPNAGQYMFDPNTGNYTLTPSRVDAAAPAVLTGGTLTAPTDNLTAETEAVTGARPGVDQRAATTSAEDILMAASPDIQKALFKPGSSDRYTGTFVDTFKVVDGKLVPTAPNAEDIAAGNLIFYVGGAPGGDYAGQQRVAQGYVMKGGQLTPIGEAKPYIVPKETPFFKEFLIEGVLPMLLAAAGGSGLAETLGGALSGGALTGASAASLGSGALNLGAQLLRGADPMDAIKTTVLTGGVNAAANSLGALLPAEFAAAGKNILSQLITTGKINPVALATSMGMSAASDVIAAETGLDKATAGRLLNAGYQAAQGNLTGATASLLQSGALGSLGTGSTSGMSPQDRAAFLEANAAPLGLSVLSLNPTEDELIDLQSRTDAATQLLNDYAASGSDISRENALSRLTSLGITGTKAEELLTNADRASEQRRVATDVMSRYSKIDPEFGTPQLDRQTAVNEMVAAGMSSERANELLNGVDAQNAIKLENKFGVQAAYQNLLKGVGSEEALRSAMTSAGYADADINDTVTRARGVIEGGKLTSGEQAQVRAENLPDVRADIAGKSTFSDAYALAREKLGAGATFTWQGKNYSTATFQEDPKLGLVPVAGSGRGEAAGKTVEQEAALENTRQQLAAAAAKPTSLISSIGNWLSNQMKLSSEAAQNYLKNNPNSPITQSVSTAYDAAGELLSNVAGGTALLLNNIPLANEFIKSGGDLQKFGQSIGTGPQDTANFNDTMQLLTAAQGVQEKLAVLAGRVLDGTSGLARQTVIELRQELPALFLGGAGARAAMVASGLIDTADTAGNAAIGAYDDAVRSGKTHDQALLDARKAGAAAGATEAAIQVTIGKLGELAVGKLDNVVSKATGKVLGEGVTESGQEAGASAAVDLALGQSVDVNKALTQGIIGGAIGKSTALSTAPVDVAQDLGGSNTLSSTVDKTAVSGAVNNLQSLYGDTKTSQIVSNLTSATDLSAAGQTLAANLSNLMGDNAAVSTANTLVSNMTVSRAAGSLDASGATVNNLSTVVGKTADGGDITLANALGSSITGNGPGVATSTTVGTKADGSPLTLGELTTQVKSAIVGGGGVAATATGDMTSGASQLSALTGGTSAATGTAATTSGTSALTGGASTSTAADTAAKAGTGVTAATDTALTGGTSTSTAADTTVKSGVVSNTTTDAQTGVTTNTQTDTKTGVITQTIINNVAGSTTTITSNPNNATDTKVTQLTEGSITTVVDTKTNVTTNTAVDTTTNTTTVTTVNGNTGEVVIEVVDTETGDVIDKEITTVTELTPEEKALITVEPPKPLEPVSKPPEPKPKTPQPTPAAGLIGGVMSLRGGEPEWLGPQFLKSKERDVYFDPLAEFKALQEETTPAQPLAIQPELANVLMERGAMPYYAYGQEPSIDDVLGLPDEESSSYNESDYVPVFKSGGKVSPLNIQMMYAKGGHAREDFRDGKHVAGPGDGQSDDIPAWLADGEFVFPADVVSALGNGSTKAGTEKLYEMMHEIRGRARSKHPKDLPPPAHKSPLDYLKKGK